MVRVLVKACFMASSTVSTSTNLRSFSTSLGISRRSFSFSGLKLDQARQFKRLESENARLKKLVADLSLDNAILKEAANPNF